MASVFGIGEIIAGSLLDVFGTEQRIAAEEEANRERQKAIDDRMREEKIAANNSTLQHQQQLLSVISSQEAKIGASGFSAGSASFKAIQEDTFNQFAKDQTARNLSLEFKESQLREEKEQYNDQTKWDVGSALFEGATSLFDFGVFNNFNFNSTEHNKFSKKDDMRSGSKS